MKSSIRAFAAMAAASMLLAGACSSDDDSDSTTTTIEASDSGGSSSGGEVGPQTQAALTGAADAGTQVCDGSGGSTTTTNSASCARDGFVHRHRDLSGPSLR